jgi:hypothetical protein
MWNIVTAYASSLIFIGLRLRILTAPSEKHIHIMETHNTSQNS